MWREYFGQNCRVYGVDIEPACRAYEDDVTRVLIGDQADRGFWARFRREVPRLDIVIDDGGHRPKQQITSLQELFPHLSRSGVYICEDLGEGGFVSYVNGFVRTLNWSRTQHNDCDNERRLVSPANAFQSEIDSITFYPFVTVIEKRNALTTEFSASKHGSQWQPFLK